MGFLICEIWNMMAKQIKVEPSEVRLLIHTKISGKNPECITTADTRRRRTKSQKILSREMLQDWIEKAVGNCHVRLGDVVLLQIRGIPMGMNASPFLSDLYLFAYEIDFMQQFLPNNGMQGTSETWYFFKRHFEHSVRYQDDRWASSSKYIARALSFQGWWGIEDENVVNSFSDRHPFRGIYPTQYLELKIEQEDDKKVQHQDLYIVRQDESGVRTRWLIKLYDRKSDPALAQMLEYIVYFNQPDTFLADSCIYGVVYSQMRRIAKRCTIQVDFEDGVTLMIRRMRDLGYNQKKLKTQIKKFFRQFPALFGQRSGLHMELRICRVVDGRDWSI